MLFSSYSFVLYFFPICLVLSVIIRRFANLRFYTLFLTGASLLFYSFGHVPYLLLILASIGFNYPLAKAIHRSARHKKHILIFGVFLNLSLLTYYKYTNFFIDIYSQVTDIPILYTVILPIGISFYTFQQVMYLVDTYKEKVVKHDFLTYALYISFFPQLIAGPIVHQKQFLQQFFNKKLAENVSENLSVGFSFFAYGLFKKIVIADQIEAIFVNPVFNASLTGSVSFWEAWIGTIAYAFQIYYDFSGYSDMAFGLGKCFGIELPLNFNSPYKSKSLREFWRRWHITLSLFLRDYLYIPLGGNRVPKIRKIFNVIVTMFLAGLWHGAGWGFMIWGFLHGVGIAVNHWLAGKKNNLTKQISILNTDAARWAFTFVILCMFWVPFRAETMVSMFELWKSMFTVIEILDIETLLYPERYVLLLLVLLCHCLFCPNLFQIFEKKLHYVEKDRLDMVVEKARNITIWEPNFFWALSAAAAFYISFLLMGTVNSFIYFQF